MPDVGISRMSTFSWASGIGGDWNTAELWDVGLIPNSGAAVVAIVQPGLYTVTIAAGETETVGTLNLAAATLSVDGVLQLAATAQPAISQGDATVVVGMQGVIDGYGSFAPGILINAGTVIANDGTLGSLILDSAITGTGTLAAAFGSTLILAGGTVGVLDAAGRIFDTGSLAITGSLTGGGTVIAENGGALELGGASTADLSFAGSNGTITLDSPAQYQGTMIGFGQGDSLILKDVLASGASVINANTLTITTDGSTIALALAGDYSSATFTTRTVGGNTVISNIAGTPARRTAVATFNCPATEAAYAAAINAGTSVPLPPFLTNGSLFVDNFYHVGNTPGAPLQNDLLTTAFVAGTSFPISNIDLAMLQDIGAPVTAFVTCYAKGTSIQTTRGDVAVEDQRPGDWVVTLIGVVKPVVWIGRRHLDCRRHAYPKRVWPIRIGADAFAAGQPGRDLFVSPDHAIYCAGVLIPVRLLLNSLTIVQTDRPRVDYFHVELDSHDILLAEGRPAESYLDCGDRHSFENGGGILTLFAAIVGRKRGYAPLTLRGPEPDAVRAQLFARATSLTPGADSAAVATA